jgi:hypothetical protein
MLRISQKREKSLSSIGTKKESSLHRSLKLRYSGIGGATETPIGDYVCDGQTIYGEIIEVQTASFGPIKEKVKDLTQNSKVRIIHPIIAQKHIELFDLDGGLLHKRKSPREGSIWDLFSALVHAPELPLLKNLTIELAVVDVTEKRLNDGEGSWRRKGVSIKNRFLKAWHSGIILKRKKDYLQFIPFKKNEQFTVRDLSEKAKINKALAQKTLYTLEKMKLLKRIGKSGKAIIYKLENR